MIRLPTPGSDDGQWGEILNDFLRIAHNDDGSEKGVSLPSQWTVNDTTGEVIATNPSGADSTTVLTIQQPASSSNWSAVQVIDDQAALNTLISSDGVAVIDSANGRAIELSRSQGFAVLDQNSGVFTVLSDGVSYQTPSSAKLFTVATNGDVTMATTDGSVNLAVRANASQTGNLQEWRDSTNNPLAWIGPDGTPGGTLGSSSTLPPVATIVSSVTCSTPSLSSIAISTSTPLDPLHFTYGQISVGDSVPSVPYPTGVLCQVGTSYVFTVDTRNSAYSLTLTVIVSNQDTSEHITLRGSATASSSTATDQVTLSPSDMNNVNSLGSDLSYNSGTGTVSSAAGGTYSIRVTLETDWQANGSSGV